MVDYLPAILLLAVLAAIFQADAVLTIFYLLVGVFLVSRWSSRAAFHQVTLKRQFTPHAFLNQPVSISLEFHNTGWLPVAWLHIHESLPIELISPNFYRQVLSLKPHGEALVSYSLMANKRGYHPIGPAFLSSGDLLGLNNEVTQQCREDHLTVFPKIVPLAGLSIPSQSPFGTLRYHQPVFEDPSRVQGKRDYRVGDSIRKIDWKTSAATGRLQVKQFEASIALDTLIFLDMHTQGYTAKTYLDATELAVVLASSIANWVIAHKQSAGLCTNGFDPILGAPAIQRIPSHRGTGHLMILLETLARVQPSNQSMDFLAMLRQSLPHLAWGTTIILITGSHRDDLFDALFQARRSGLSPVVYLVGPNPNLDDVRAQARHYGFPIFQVEREGDLDFTR